MIDLKIVSACDPLPDQLEQYKQYASVPDDTRDAILSTMLKRAMLAVQEHADVALLPCTFELTVTDIKAGARIRLYQGGTTVASVIDAEGNAVEYTQEGGFIVPTFGQKALTISYSNEVAAGSEEQYAPVVWQLATAIYDGEDAKVQAAILNSTHGW